MPPRKHPAPARPRIDMEEIRPDLFFIRNDGVRPLIRSEGELDGKRFHLTSWRREGMLARLAMQGFAVVTLDDYIDGLPELPDADLPPATPTGNHPISRTDRYSRFCPQQRGWVPLAPVPPTPQQPQPHIALAAGWVLRRRQGRGNARYYAVQAAGKAGFGLRALDELEALLLGYAQAALLPAPPVPLLRQGDTVLLPALLLPALHRDLLGKLAQPAPPDHALVAGGWLAALSQFERLERVLATLGLAVQLTPHSQ